MAAHARDHWLVWPIVYSNLMYTMHENCHDVFYIIINPLARMRSEGYCSCRVCVCVCLLSHISLLERLFVLKTLSRTQRATKVKKFVGFSLKPLRCRDPALPPLYGHAYSRPFFSCTRMRISRVYTRMIHRRGFSTLVLFIVVAMPRQDSMSPARANAVLSKRCN